MLPDIVISRTDEIISYLTELWVENISHHDIMLQAFVHKSFAMDYTDNISHNERLEFLGDSVLGHVISQILFADYPDEAESTLTLYKIALVRESTLAKVARDINLWAHLFLGNGEDRMWWRDKDSVLSDALEALIWYLSLVWGYDDAFLFIKTYLYPEMEMITTQEIKSYKTLFQEAIQDSQKLTPYYEDYEHEIDATGTVTTYRSEVYVEDGVHGEGFGRNKKKAQEAAAKQAYQQLS